MKTATVFDVEQHDDHKYKTFLSQIQKTFVETATGSLFTTDATGLFDAFLDGFPPELRQHYTCNACRRFVETFGGLVAIKPDGITIPMMWPDIVPELYREPVKAARRIVEKAKVTGAFLHPHNVWGQPVTGEWNHMAVVSKRAFNSTIKTAFQAMAEKKEDYKTLINGLVEFPLPAVEQAVKLLKTDSLYRSEKCLGVAEWFVDLHIKRNSTKNQTIKRNLTWLAVATAPAGFCHIKSTMIGTLLEDIVSGLSFDVISRRFADKMHPLQYLRPQAAPSAGTIAQAEKIIAQMQAAGSLRRRFARSDEVKAIWRPVQKEEDQAKEGVFSHLQAKDKKAEEYNIKLPTRTMTWVKFAQSVLPEAKNIELFLSGRADNFAAILTASDTDAPPIIQWDDPDNRNPFSLYLYASGSKPCEWNLSAGNWKVTGICYDPSMWGEHKPSNRDERIILLIDGAKDLRYKKSGVALFPEILKSEFHGIRSVLEAYSRNAEIEGYEDSSANGLLLGKGSNWGVRLKVDGVDYKLDRWD